MHFIVTSVFWIIVFKTADRNNGNYDLWYFIFAHGITLLLLLIDGIIGKVVFDMKILPL